MDRNEQEMQTDTRGNVPATLAQHKRALLLLLGEFDRVCRQLDISYTLFAGTMLGAVRHEGFIPWDDDLDVLMMREDYDRFIKEADQVLDQEKFFLQKEFSDHWPMFFSKLRINNTTCLETYHPKDPMTHQGVYIDLFPCDNAYQNAWARKLQFFASKVVIAKSLTRRGYETRSSKKKMFMGLCRLFPMRPFLRLARGGAPDSQWVHTFLGAASRFSKNVYPREYFAHTVMLPFEDGEFPAASKYHEILTTLYGDYMRIPPPEERSIKRHAVLVDLEHPYEMYREYHLSLTFDVVTKSIR